MPHPNNNKKPTAWEVNFSQPRRVPRKRIHGWTCESSRQALITNINTIWTHSSLLRRRKSHSSNPHIVSQHVVVHQDPRNNWWCSNRTHKVDRTCNNKGKWVRRIQSLTTVTRSHKPSIAHSIQLEQSTRSESLLNPSVASRATRLINPQHNRPPKKQAWVNIGRSSGTRINMQVRWITNCQLTSITSSGTASRTSSNSPPKRRSRIDSRSSIHPPWRTISTLMLLIRYALLASHHRFREKRSLKRVVARKSVPKKKIDSALRKWRNFTGSTSSSKKKIRCKGLTHPRHRAVCAVSGWSICLT